VHESLQPDFRRSFADRADVVERVFAREDDSLDPELVHQPRPRRVVHRHLRGPVDLELRVHPTDELHESDVLDDGSVDAMIDRVAEQLQRRHQLVRLHEGVEREVHPPTALVSESARLPYLAHRQLRSLIAGIEPLRAEVHCVGAVRDGCADGVE
jgi:hypothetical protein